MQKLHEADPSTCLAFGVQICVLVLDVWWGWLDDEFRSWAREMYPWLIFLFCPPNCTPVYQPCDCGLIATAKRMILGYYERQVAAEVGEQLAAGNAPKDVQVSSGASLLKANQAIWLGKASREMTARAGESCWEKTGLLVGWQLKGSDLHRQAENGLSAKLPAQRYSAGGVPVLCYSGCI